jgi:HD-GYP domain-containing protein (c-di-GMP phosphodiesterase class II)
MARILCIADSYDSMTANRPYRSARGREYAVEEFRRCSGTQFDPKLVEVFLKVVESGEA